MTRDEALALIPPGWVECNEASYSEAHSDRSDRMWIGNVKGHGYIYAIPAPKPEPRRVPCVSSVTIEFDRTGFGDVGKPEPYPDIRNAIGGYDAVANTTWRLDFDAREWVEVLE